MVLLSRGVHVDADTCAHYVSNTLWAVAELQQQVERTPAQRRAEAEGFDESGDRRAHDVERAAAAVEQYGVAHAEHGAAQHEFDGRRAMSLGDTLRR